MFSIFLCQLPARRAGGLSPNFYLPTTNVEPVFVLGVDPGLSRCGYCVLRVDGRRSAAVALGVIRTEAGDPIPRRLAEIAHDFRAIFEEFPLASVAIERVLFQVNVSTAMGVGQAAGLVMAEAASRGLYVAEYSPNEVKDAVAGYGGANKAQVQTMVQTLLSLPTPPKPPDAADAAAVALTHVAVTGGRMPSDEAIGGGQNPRVALR